MNRIHKFRAIIPARNIVIVFTLADLLDNKFSNREILWPWLQSGNQPDEFTGLLDSQGNEIYEGDVLETRTGKITSRGVMQWDDSGRWATFSPLSAFEAIGNIYENPELLEQA